MQGEDEALLLRERGEQLCQRLRVAHGIQITR